MAKTMEITPTTSRLFSIGAGRVGSAADEEAVGDTGVAVVAVGTVSALRRAALRRAPNNTIATITANRENCASVVHGGVCSAPEPAPDPAAEPIMRSTGRTIATAAAAATPMNGCAHPRNPGRNRGTAPPRSRRVPRHAHPRELRPPSVSPLLEATAPA